MSNAATNHKTPAEAGTTTKLTPTRPAIATVLSGSRHDFPVIVQGACAAIAASYRRAGFSQADAREQADAFAERCQQLDYDAEVAAVAAIMVAS
jgi:hypothetical protein